MSSSADTTSNKIVSRLITVPSLLFLAKAQVGQRDQKENNCGSDKDQIQHCGLLALHKQFSHLSFSSFASGTNLIRLRRAARSWRRRRSTRQTISWARETEPKKLRSFKRTIQRSLNRAGDVVASTCFSLGVSIPLLN